MPPSLAAGLAARCQPRVVRSPAARAPGVRSGRSCHTQPTRPGSLPYGQPSAPGGLRIRAYGSPLARSAYGRVLSPPCAAVRPNARSTGGAWSACVTPGQRRTPYAWSSGLLRSPGCPRTSSPSASASGKCTPQTVTSAAAASHQRPHPRYRNRHTAAPQDAAAGPRQLHSKPHPCQLDQQLQAAFR